MALKDTWVDRTDGDLIDPNDVNQIAGAVIELEENGVGGGTGADGKSAYEIAVENGFEGSETEWLASLKGEQGIQGEQGDNGANGYTPQKGVDYWNAEDKEEIEADISAEVSDQLADKAQLQPEYADSIEELEEKGDTSKLYVLPDGYIYANMKKTIEGSVTPNFKNLLDDAGYVENTYLSGGNTGTRNNVECTGFMPLDGTGEYVIYLSGITATTSTSNFRFAFYKADKSVVVQLNNSNLESNVYAPIVYETGEDGNIVKLDCNAFMSALVNQEGYDKTPAYFRLCSDNIDSNSIITVNQPITYTIVEGGTYYEWTNTGHAFVPADYEDRIIGVEEKAESNSNRLGVVEDALKGFSPDTEIPVLVKEGASALVDKALSREDNRVIRFLISSDAHQYNKNALISAGNKEMGQAYKVVLDQMGIDFVANLGDIAWGAYADTTEEVREQLKQFNAFMSDAVKGETLLYVEGNHDDANYSTIDNDGDGTTASLEKLNASAVYGLIWGKNKGVVCDNAHVIDGYCYKDFENLKVRVICLNTEQGTGDGGVVEGYQLKWFAEQALDMSNKTDWSVITIGHHPLSFNTVSLFKYAVEIVKAFINGASLSLTTNDGVTFSFDYNGKNCQYVGHFHGHAHAFSVVKMQRYVASGSYEEINAWEICIPNACYTRNNQYRGNGEYTERFSTETTYDKADVDGQRTSFNLVTVCLDEKKIYADNYGAGIDRVINY